MKSKMKDTTLVTCFYDIGRKTDDPIGIFENYPQWINRLLEENINLIFFTTQTLHDKLTYTPRDNLKFILSDEIPLFDEIAKYEHAWTVNKYWTNNPRKDTIPFALIMHNKFIFLKMAMEMNPFNAEHYAWIDAGIVKVAENPELLPKLLPKNKIVCLQMNQINKSEVDNPAFYLACRYKIAGGFFVGPKKLMTLFCDKMIERREELMKIDVFGTEQEYIAWVFFYHRELFLPYWGDYQYLFSYYPYRMIE